MTDPICFIVPPHLLEAMAESSDEEVRECAAKTLVAARQLCSDRQAFFQDKLSRSHSGERHTSVQQSIVPNILLEHLSQSDNVDKAVKKSALKSLALSQQIRGGHDTALAAAARADDANVAFHRGVYDMKNQGNPKDRRSFNLLPGEPVRLEGQPATKDKAVNEAYDSALQVLNFYKKIFNYNSLDNYNLPVISSVHFSKDFGNAFWYSGKQQMVYGDGNKYLYNFTTCIDVIGHEMTHAVTGFNSGLLYWGESGALNEHVSDVFGIMIKQMVENETARKADWLIGEGCLMPGVAGVSIRNMQAPGTAYNDPKFGMDIQPANYANVAAVTAKYRDSVENDNGGVHIFSGIPNKAFHLCAVAFDGFSWEKAGKIWWVTVTTNRIPSSCSFLQFADATVDVATELYGNEDAKIVRNAWNEVGVVRKN